MLAASAHSFIPFGRKHMKRHVGSTCSIPVPRIDYSNNETNFEDVDDKDSWIIRENIDGIEEELYVQKNVVVWSQGNFTSSTRSLEEDDHTISRALIRSYTVKRKVQQALWCTFKNDSNLPSSIGYNSKDVEAVCISDNKQLYIYIDGGEEYFTSLPFKISKIWESKFGLIMERSVTTVDHTNANVAFPAVNMVPTVFSLTHPLDEMSPFLMIKQGPSVNRNLMSYMKDPFKKIVFVSKEPSICIIYDCKANEHSVWKIRKITELEKSKMKIPVDLPQDGNDGVNPVLTLLNSNNSLLQNLTNKTGAGNSISHIASPLNNQPNISAFHSTITKLNSSLFNIGKRTGSFSTTPNVKFSPNSRLTSSPRNSPLIDARLGNNQSVVLQSRPKAIMPELCFEYLWTEISENSICENFPASSAFISRDFVGNKYLCYLITQKSHLLCVKLDKSNELSPDIIFGTTTRINAIDAAFLEMVNTTVVMESSERVSLYSGTSLVGQVMLGCAPSLQYLTPSCRITTNIPIKPSRSSLISPSNNTSDDKIDKHFEELSPVKSQTTCSNSQFSSNTLLKIHNGNNSHVIFKKGDETYVRVKFPALCSSSLVERTINVLKIILPKDVSLNFLIVWYQSRNAPGTQDISSEQEWKLFLEVLLRCLGYDINLVPLIKKLYDNPKEKEDHTQPKKKKESNDGNDNDWKYLLESNYNKENFIRINNLFNLQNMDIDLTYNDTSISELNTTACLYQYFHDIYFSLHLMYEDLKLNTMNYNSLTLIVQLLYQMATDINLDNYVHHYWRNHPQIVTRPALSESNKSKNTVSKSSFAAITAEPPPDILASLLCIVQDKKVNPYPFINGVNNLSLQIISIYTMIFNRTEDNVLQQIEISGIRNRTVNELFVQYKQYRSIYNHIESLISLMVMAGFNLEKINNLPAGIAWPLMDIIHRCRECPREDWSISEYDLLAREDLSSQVRQKAKEKPKTTRVTTPAPKWKEIITTEIIDGMENIDKEYTKLLWPKDKRIIQVRKMLQSSTPVLIDIQQRPEINSNDFVDEQQRYLSAMCTRTLALPVGRSMFTLHTSTPSITEPMNIPPLCLIGKAVDTGTTVDLSNADVPPLWPSFHNGMAAGLRISPKADINSAWILFNKPKGDLHPEHAGFLMALGLNGQLKKMKKFNMFDYLQKHHEFSGIALLTGLACTYRGTMDIETTKLLCIHLECFLPPTSLDLNVIQNIQIAAILGMGLVYQGSAHRHYAEVLLAEMGRPPGPEMDNCLDRESYTLAAGLALGLILLGKGSDLSGLMDLAIPDTLHYYMVGGHKRPFSGPQKEKYKLPSYQIREGDIMNVDITSPGATLALGFMFFDSGNKTVADWMKAPDTQYILDKICPDFILLRTLAKGLILWSDIIPTREWVESHIPSSIRPYCLIKPKPDQIPPSIDLETINQAYCNIVAGACFAIGLKFAGSGNNTAFKTVRHYCNEFISLFGKSISELAGKSTVENCQNVTVIALSLIMASTGDVEVFRICRYLRSRVYQTTNNVVTYGSHMATSLALGFLFLGGGRCTLSTSPESIAALIIALYPKFPTHSNDNRYHLQAFRHLYVLATEPRLLIPRDIDRELSIYVNIDVHFKETQHYKSQQVKMKAPCMLPELKYLDMVEIKDDRYWPIVFKRGKNWDQLENILSNSLYIYIKQRSGFLPYHEDSDGYCILSASPCTIENSLPWSPNIDCMKKYTSDPSILKLMDSFFKENYSEADSDDEIQFNSMFKRIVHECIIQDKLYILPLWSSMLKVIQKMKRFPNAYYCLQIKLFYCFILYCTNLEDAPSPTLPLTSFELASVVKHYLHQLVECWEKDNNLDLPSCFEKTSGMSGKKLTEIEQIKSTMLTLHEVPIPQYHSI